MAPEIGHGRAHTSIGIDRQHAVTLQDNAGIGEHAVSEHHPATHQLLSRRAHGAHARRRRSDEDSASMAMMVRSMTRISAEERA